MRIRKGMASVGVLMVPVFFAACGGDAADEAPRPATDVPAAQPTTGAPQQPTQVATGPLPPGVTQEMVNEGRQVFHGQGICFTCHGQDGQGTPLGPNLADGSWIWVTEDSDKLEQIVTITRTGVTQPREYPAPMPPMGGANLNDDQLRSVAAYVYSLNPQG